MPLAGDFDDEQTIGFRPAGNRPPRMAGAELLHTLLLLNEQGPATRIPLRDNLLLAGRRPPAALILPGAMVSRRHCQFERQGNNVVVSDLNSTNGTFVDNVRIATTTVLSDGARIAIGEHNLRYYRSAMIEPGPQRLVIEIDERKKAAEVAEITGSDYFRDLLEQTRKLALRRSDKTGK